MPKELLHLSPTSITTIIAGGTAAAVAQPVESIFHLVLWLLVECTRQVRKVKINIIFQDFLIIKNVACGRIIVLLVWK